MRAALVVAVVAVVGCTDVDVGGRYELIEVEGESLPAEIAHDYEVVGGFIEVEPDSLFGATDTRSVADGDTVEYHLVFGGTVEELDDERLVVGVEEEPVDLCVVTSIYRIEDDGDRLRSIDAIGHGDCPGGEDAIIPIEMLYERVD